MISRDWRSGGDGVLQHFLAFANVPEIKPLTPVMLDQIKEVFEEPAQQLVPVWN